MGKPDNFYLEETVAGEVMYEVFDGFLSTDTWHTGHPADDTRFYQALHHVIRKLGFNPDEMARYMREKKDVPNDPAHPLYRPISDRASQAWAVRDYLLANNL